MYLVEHNDGNQSIEAPPILLSQYHQGDDTNIKAHVLCTTNTTQSDRDNEDLYIQVLVCRLGAYKLLGVKLIQKASKLLGVHLVTDYSV